MSSVRRRALLGRAISAAAVVALTSCGVIEQTRPATKKRIPRIGLMVPAPEPETKQRAEAAFHEGLRERGYVDGESVRVEPRYGQTRRDDWAEFVAEFIAMPERDPDRRVDGR